MKYTILSLLLLGSISVSAETQPEERLEARSIESQGGKQSEWINKSAAPVDPAQLAKSTKTANTQSAKQGALPQQRKLEYTRSANPDFWVFDAFVELNSDSDYDGFYSYFTVEFDVDTVYSDADIYARLFLSRGDVFEEYHTSSVFQISGDSSFDSIVIESELVSGFAPGDYELLIEIYDAYDDSLVAIYDGYDDADLSFISLESRSYEESQTVVVVTESGGSFGYLILLVVPLLIRRQFIRA